MWHTRTENFKRQYDEQILYLEKDFRYPSLQAKKYGGTENMFQARVDQHYRFYFTIDGDCYILIRIVLHPK